VFSFDQNLVDYLADQGYKNNVMLVPSKWLDYNLSANFSSFSDVTYTQLTKSKTNIWNSLLLRNYSFMFSDPDVAWLSERILDHVKFQYEHSFAEILFTQDVTPRFTYCNTGFFYATPTPFVKALLGKMLILQRSAQYKDLVEQYILQEILSETKFNDSRLDTLDLLLYANGDVHFHKNLNKIMNITPLAVHANYLIGQAAKKRLLKFGGYWYL
jgi:hypothetical protein